MDSSSDLIPGYFYFIFYDGSAMVVEYCADYVSTGNKDSSYIDRYFIPIWEIEYAQYEYVDVQPLYEEVGDYTVLKEIGMYFDENTDIQILKSEFPEYFI